MLNEISPLKEATLRRRDEAIYPIRKVLQAAKVKYAFYPPEEDERASSQTLEIRFPNVETTPTTIRTLGNALALRGFIMAPEREPVCIEWSNVHKEAAGFETRTCITLSSAQQPEGNFALSQITIRSEPI